ncbi:hypothetical protein DFH09DRAFT_1104322 [Mycena vulgaris]|nr:hypothetical protein DFH09DRAFT_1104322 [Mycena vulgaris]
MHQQASTIHKTGGNSKRLWMLGTERKSAHLPGRSIPQQVTLNTQDLDKYRRDGEKKLQERLQNMDAEHQEGFDRLQNLATDDDFHAGDVPEAPNMISHASSEFTSLEQDIEDDSGNEGAWTQAKQDAFQQQTNWRTRRNHTEHGNLTFQGQMSQLLSAYFQMCAEGEISIRPDVEEEHEVNEEIYELTVVDMFDELYTSDIDVKLDPRANGIVPALILQRMMPCAPWMPTITIKIHVLKAYRVTHLKGKDALIFSILKTMNSNNSLKRFLQREKTTMVHDEADDLMLAKLREHVNNRDAGNSYYLSQEKVDKWVKSWLGEQLPMQSGNADEDNPCADRWKNMINDMMSKMWGIFDKTGVFLVLCHHGFVLVLVNMIKSGELAKYPLTVVKELLGAFRLKTSARYDIGCHFGVTVDHSELGEEAREKELKCLVGSFHGHTHNRLCQLRFLATYIEGMGLKDLEGCERFFSRSNGLAKSCCYASRFHCQQEITTYVKHFDSFETYTNLVACEREGLPPEPEECPEGECGNARNGVRTEVSELEPKPVSLRAKHTIVTAEARCAREDNMSYKPGVLKAGLGRRQAREKMEKDLDSVLELEAALDIVEWWTTTSPKWVATVDAVKKRKYQLALDTLEWLIIKRIFELRKMNRSQTDKRSGPKCASTGPARLVAVQERSCLTDPAIHPASWVLDQFGLLQHITKALQARSKAVCSAIEHYNTAACALSPPMPQLSWEQVGEYTFLADFNILQDMHAEIRSQPWTRPAYRLVMDRYFKILHMHKEIKRLNVEIPCVVTWIRDETAFLHKMEANLRDEAGKLEEQIVEDMQMAVQRFYELTAESGLTGSLRCGVAVKRREIRERLRGLREQAARKAGEIDVDGQASEVGDNDNEWVDADSEGVQRRVDDEGVESDQEGEGDEARDAAVSHLVYQISMVAVDGMMGDVEWWTQLHCGCQYSLAVAMCACHEEGDMEEHRSFMVGGELEEEEVPDKGMGLNKKEETQGEPLRAASRLTGSRDEGRQQKKTSLNHIDPLQRHTTLPGCTIHDLWMTTFSAVYSIPHTNLKKMQLASDMHFTRMVKNECKKSSPEIKLEIMEVTLVLATICSDGNI